VLNDRAALDLLLGGEMLTRSQISEYTGVSKVTVSQMLTRLEERGLVAIAGEQAGGPGPERRAVLGRPVQRVRGRPVRRVRPGQRRGGGRYRPPGGRGERQPERGTDDPVELVRGTIEQACATPGSRSPG
jgi:Uncharacterized membrane-associated protein/domain